MEEPINIYPWNGRRDKSNSKTCDMSVSLGVDEYISLGEGEPVTERSVVEKPHTLKVPVDEV